MKTGKSFSLKEVVDVTDFSDRQVRNLTEYGLLPSKSNSPKYNLNEVIYCRISYYLRKEYSMQKIRDLIKPCHCYDNELMYSDNAFIFLEDNEKLHLGTLDTPEYRLLMKNNFVNFQRQILYGEKDVERKNLIVFNLVKIRDYLKNRAENLNFDSIDLKFSRKHQSSSEVI